MTRYSSPSDNEPVMVVRGHALYTAHMIVAGFTVTMILTSILAGLGFSGALAKLAFNSEAVWRGELWRLFTYGVVNPPSLSFVIEMFMMVIFGRELEKFFGRRTFLTLYGSLYLLSPLVFTALAKWVPMTLAGASGAFALFIAFATLYPNAIMLFNLVVKWVAIVLVGLYTLIHISQQNVGALLSLWITSAFAFAFVRYEQGRLTMPRFTTPKRKPKTATTPRATAPKRATNVTTPVVNDDVDAILDKIARDGFHSLTPAERAILDKSSEALMKKRGTPRTNASTHTQSTPTLRVRRRPRSRRLALNLQLREIAERHPIRTPLFHPR